MYLRGTFYVIIHVFPIVHTKEMIDGSLLSKECWSNNYAKGREK